MSKVLANSINNKGINHKKSSKIMAGECIFPFEYKGEMRNECVPGNKGPWCATKVNSKNQPLKIGFCKTKKKKVTITVAKSKKPKVVITAKKSKIAKPTQTIDVSKHLPTKKRNLSPPYWYLPNRKNFSNWFDKSFEKYRISKSPKKLECAEAKVCKKIDLFTHQQIVRDYLQVESPYRGLLLYHGLGVGKTCASIAIAEGLKHNRTIYILLNKSLKQNFRLELMKCGDEYYRLNNHWTFVSATPGTEYFKFMLDFGIPRKLIIANKGGWLIDFSKKPNYDSLSARETESLKAQISEMIDNKYKFIHMNGLTSKKLREMREKKILDNSLLIIDEVHNLTNGMAKAKPGVRAGYLDKIIMEAENLRLVFLSGTPMINNLFEAGKMFNLLRGYINTFNIIIKPGQKIDWSKIEELRRHPLIDQFFYKKSDKIISLTRNPYGFVSNPNISQGGVISDTDFSTPNINKINDDQFLDIILQTFKDLSLDIDYTIQRHTALPNDEDKFMRLFYDQESENIKNINLFKTRIMGLVSHYRTFKKDLMPEVTKEEIIDVPMSDYQFLQYSIVRKDEIDKDRKKKPKAKAKVVKPAEGTPSPGKPVENILSQKSSYRAYSRMRCSFVFPETIERPVPGHGMDKEAEIDIEDVVEDADAEPKKDDKAYEKAKNECLKKLDSEKYEHLIEGDPDRLLKYSPKYDTIVKKIKSINGSSFVYTEYRTLEGIAVFSVVLKANGFSEFKLEQNEIGEWSIRDTPPEDVGKPKFAFWSGDEESGLMLKIFNNDWESLPEPLKSQVKSLGTDNKRGDIIKVILTTKKGAEGISIYNIRQVHIIEPYWNPVRLEQVKGRAIRTGSHLSLPPEDRNVELYLYLSTLTSDQLKSDKTIQDDSNGHTSDQVLFEISQKKLKIMQTLLNAIKEVSIDCSLNLLETQDEKNPFKCINPKGKDNDDYSFIPNILKEREDREQKRAQKVTSWTGQTANIPKIGKVVIREYEGRRLLYNYEKVQTGRAGDPIGEIIGKKIKLYK